MRCREARHDHTLTWVVIWIDNPDEHAFHCPDQVEHVVAELPIVWVRTSLDHALRFGFEACEVCFPPETP